MQSEGYGFCTNMDNSNNLSPTEKFVINSTEDDVRKKAEILYCD